MAIDAENITILKRKRLQISEVQIGGKLLECDFFVGHMENAADTLEFGYYLSAFLGSLSTLTSEYPNVLAYQADCMGLSRSRATRICGTVGVMIS